jgi:hypothetical protein
MHLLCKTSDAMIVHDVFAEVQTAVGRAFTHDVAADDLGINAQTRLFFSPLRSFMRQHRLPSDAHLWVNPPFHDLHTWVTHYGTIKSAQPDISACFVVPVNPRTGESEAVNSLIQKPEVKLVREYEPQSPIFQAIDGTLYGVPWPVRVYYDPPSCVQIPTTGKPSVMSSRTENAQASEKMSFEAKLAGQKAPILLDTGATHNFLDDSFRRSIGVPLQPSLHTDVSFANDSGTRLLGECTFAMNLAGMKVQVTALVMTMPWHDHA